MATKILTKPKEAKPETKRNEVCVHHWVIEPPEGPVSKGVCKICGAEKDFHNHKAYSDWGNESSSISRIGRDFGNKSQSEDGEDTYS